MNSNSIRAYLLKLFFVVLIIIVGISFALNNIFSESYYLYKNEKNFEKIYEEVYRILTNEEILAESLIEENLIEELLFELDRQYQVTIEIFDRDYRIIMASHRISTTNTHPIDSKIHSLVRNHRDRFSESHIYKTIEPSSSNISGALVYINKIDNNQYALITRPLQPVGENINIMNEFYLLSGLIALIIGWFFTIKFAKTFTEPIIEISEIAKNMADLNFSAKIEYNSKNELGDLAHSVNVLSEKLEKNIYALKDEIEFQKLLSRNASHELKTPVAIIKGYTEGIYYGITSNEEEERQYLDIIIKECDRMNVLIQEMLKLSKLSANEKDDYVLEEFSSLKLKEQVENTFIPLMKQQAIDFIVNINDIKIYGNLDLLVQCIYNFISNAMKYGDENEISISIDNIDNEILIKVFNTGENIDEKNMKKVFDIFHIVDEARTRDKNGHGLGLAIVKSIAEVHNGEAYGQNEENGVTFVLKFPQ